MGRDVGHAVVLGYANVTCTAGANEYFSGFDNIGHNPFMDLLFLWIIPK